MSLRGAPARFFVFHGGGGGDGGCGGKPVRRFGKRTTRFFSVSLVSDSTNESSSSSSSLSGFFVLLHFFFFSVRLSRFTRILEKTRPKRIISGVYRTLHIIYVYIYIYRKETSRISSESIHAKYPERRNRNEYLKVF